MAEYKLSYTASEIDERLGMVDNMVKTVNGNAPDENGNVEITIPSGGENIAPGTSVALDSTLSESGKAADAGAVGDALYDKYTVYEPAEIEVPLSLIGFWGSDGTGFAENSGYRATEKFSTTSVPEIVENDYMMTKLRYINFWKDGTFVGNYYHEKFYTGNLYGTSVETLGEFNEAAISVQLTNDGTDPDSLHIVGEVEPVEYRKSKFDTLKEEISGRTGKKVYLFGDSITAWDQQQWEDPAEFIIGYASHIQEKLGAKVVNCGVGGYVSRQITENLISTDLSDAYAITYQAGANDIRMGGFTIGTLGTFDTATYIGALETAAKHMSENYPDVKFYFLAPLYTSTGNTKQCAEAMQTVAEAYGIPVLRLDKVTQFNQYNIAHFTMDGLHFNNLGYQRIADTLIPFLKNN